MINVYPVVEGHGDVKAVPLLLRRLLVEKLGVADVGCFPPHRLPRNKLLIPREFSRVLSLAHVKLRTAIGKKVVLVLMDADDDCPVKLAGAVADEHGAALAQSATSIVFAVKEYEAWFIASNLDERHHRDLRPDVPRHPAPETVADAKGYFERTHLKEGRTYSETVDQAKFTACLDLEATRRASSFDKLVRDFQAIIAA